MPRGVKGVARAATPTKIQAALNRKKALELRLQGKTYQEIAEAMEWTSRRYAWRMITQELRNVPKEEANQLRQIEMARLDALTDALWSSAMGGDTDSINAMLKLMERRSRLLGLDSPHKISHGAEEGISMIGSIMAAIRDADADGDPEAIEDGSDTGDDEPTDGDESSTDE